MLTRQPKDIKTVENDQITSNFYLSADPQITGFNDIHININDGVNQECGSDERVQSRSCPMQVAMFRKKHSSTVENDNNVKGDSEESSDGHLKIYLGDRSEGDDSTDEYYRLGDGDKNDSPQSAGSLDVNWSSDDSMRVDAIVIKPLKEEGEGEQEVMP